MAGNSSKAAVTMAVVGNSILTVLKFIAFAVSGSGAMFSEALHSLADTANQALLFIGIRRSELGPTTSFHYGYGGARFFYSLLSAVGIFLLGCGVTLYHGVHSALHLPELSFGWLIFVVLGISLVIDGFVMWKAIVVVLEQKGDRGFFEYVKNSDDPTLAAVLLEDGVACLGVLIAGAAIGLSYLTQSPIPDVIATFLIGGMMGFIAIWLGLKNKELIIGRSIPDDVQERIAEYLREQPAVESITDVKSRIVGAGHFRFKAEVDWSGRELAGGLVEWVESRADDLQDPDARREFTLEFGEKMTRAIAAEIDRIEGVLRSRHPELKNVDLESH